MKNINLVIFVLLFALFNTTCKKDDVEPDDGTFTDSRDGNTYEYVTIGEQIWMAKNLAYLPSVSGPDDKSENNPYYYVYGFQGTNPSIAKLRDNYTTYGVLYNWSAAMNGASSSYSVPSGVQGICPEGWHLPSDEEWTILTDSLGSDAGKKMKSTSGWHSLNWGGDGNGNNSSGFNALPSGDLGGYSGWHDEGTGTTFWSSSKFDSIRGPWKRRLDSNYDGVYRSYPWSCRNGYSVRCLKDE